MDKLPVHHDPVKPATTKRWFQTIGRCVRHTSILPAVSELRVFRGKEVLMGRELGTVELSRNVTGVDDEIADYLVKDPFYGIKFIEVKRSPAKSVPVVEAAPETPADDALLIIDHVAAKDHEAAVEALLDAGITDEDAKDSKGRFSANKIRSFAKKQGILLPNY